MFFDWLEVDGPRRSPAPLKLQLISVPGQIERNYRRRPLVQMADVVVFVCDSSPDKIPETMRAFARLRASIKQRRVPVPLVVQVNKQDVKGAFDPDRMRRRLKLGFLVLVCRLFGDRAIHLVLEAIEIHGIRKYLTVAPTWPAARSGKSSASRPASKPSSARRWRAPRRGRESKQ